jgi:integrase
MISATRITQDHKHFLYRNYYDRYFTSLMQSLNIEETPHCFRHTCISLLTEAGFDQMIIKKITGLSRAMALTERYIRI